MAQYDIVLFGATSFVGQILTRYMLDTYGVGKEVNGAIAGRSESKLASVKSELGAAAADIPVIVADAADEAALTEMVKNTKVVVSTVGPYALYGEPLVKACATEGTDYCDLTGEPQWIEKMIRRYEPAAKVSGARIVHCCGFDSIPSDLGVFFLQNAAKEKFGKTCPSIKMRVKAMKGTASGGTVASMVNLIKEASSDPALRRVLTNPYALCPQGHPYKTRQFNQKSAVFDEDFNAWSAPFVMAAINTRVVHRSNALLDSAYSDQFKYEEAMLVGRGNGGAVRGTAMSVGLGAFTISAAIPPVRWVLENFILPKPGEGPSEHAQETGFYDLRFIGTTDDGQKIKTKVTGDKDPGYGSTAKMLGESAMCLLNDVEDLPGGFWTPSSGMGAPLTRRMIDNAGLTFDVLDD